MTLKEYCDSCQNKGSHKCHSCMGKYFDGVLQGKPTKYREKPQTNADRIRAMSDEELAEWIARTQIEAIKDAMNVLRLPYDEPDGLVEIGKTEVLEWLKQPAEE